MPNRCNFQESKTDSGPEQIEAILYYSTEKPKGCWTVCNLAGVVIDERCISAEDCRPALREADPDLNNPIPEEINWGIPGAVHD